MKNKKNKIIATVLFITIISGGSICSLMAGTSTAQTSGAYYSLVPTLLMLNFIIMPQISIESGPVLIPPACEIVILRLSERD